MGRLRSDPAPLLYVLDPTGAATRFGSILLPQVGFAIMHSILSFGANFRSVKPNNSGHLLRFRASASASSLLGRVLINSQIAGALTSRLRHGNAFLRLLYAVQKSVIERWSFVKDATGICGGIDCHEIRKRWPARLVATAEKDRPNI
jgi:hypothetical protein